MRLRVRDLRQYLLLRNVPTDTCREKEDLVELVLCHQGTEREGDPDMASFNSRSLYTPPPSTTRSASELSTLSASQGEALSRSDSSGTTNQVHILLLHPPQLPTRYTYFFYTSQLPTRYTYFFYTLPNYQPGTHTSSTPSPTTNQRDEASCWTLPLHREMRLPVGLFPSIER
ncbi:unnamed protein product [Oncorhynchus mykiss]|uniref:RNF34/RFFL SAP domain-containing protein n=1 Tax=Oncorhynchus mykiss TaxID=8022 RepID=A0A060WM12_ONCMY|nr:unnamed protein product [Oncorhynchus mykiss]